jgi:electron transfer flavoprotein beta subunit
MVIAVCLKQVVSRETTLRVNEAGTWVREADATWVLNEPDGYALEAALKLKDTSGAEVVVISAGPERVTAVLREALARGADRAIHVVDHESTAMDPQIVAASLAHALRDERADLVLTGIQSDDYGFAQVGVAIAELLGASHATLVVEIEVSAHRVRVKRELEGGWFQWVGLPLPAVLTVQSGINQLRYASLRGVMAAKRKEIRSVPSPASVTARQRIVAVSPPDRQRSTQMMSGPPDAAAAELARLLRESSSL